MHHSISGTKAVIMTTPPKSKPCILIGYLIGMCTFQTCKCNIYVLTATSAQYISGQGQIQVGVPVAPPLHPPPTILIDVFKIPFCIRMLQNKAQRARENPSSSHINIKKKKKKNPSRASRGIKRALDPGCKGIRACDVRT